MEIACQKPDLLIRKAASSEIEAVFAIYKELFAYEKSQGNTTNWHEGIYPTITTPRNLQEADALFILQAGCDICACMGLDNHQSPEYANIKWKYQLKNQLPLVIHGLCVRPACQGKGFGSHLLDFAKDFAKRHYFPVIRIDTYAQNKPALALYYKNGFELTAYGDYLLNGEQLQREAFLEYKVC